MTLEATSSFSVLQATQPQIDQTLERGKLSLKEKDDKRLDEIAQEFEALFIAQMMQPMFDTVKIDTRFGGGKGEEIFRGFMVQEYGRLMSERGGLGISALVKQQMIDLQAQAQNPGQVLIKGVNHGAD